VPYVQPIITPRGKNITPRGSEFRGRGGGDAEGWYVGGGLFAEVIGGSEWNKSRQVRVRGAILGIELTLQEKVGRGGGGEVRHEK